MASITASPNPVVFLSPTATGSTTISWSSKPKDGVVTRSDSAAVGGEKNFDGGKKGDDNGTKTDNDLHLGDTYTYVLRDLNSKAALASVTVTTEDQAQHLTDQMAQMLLIEKRNHPPQEIFNVTVIPGVETVRILFHTIQPTIPSLTCETADGTPVPGWLPLFGGLQTNHECMLGQQTPLAQNTLHRFKIIASGHTTFGRASEATLTAEFTTGSRNATFFFDRIKVRKDGDPAGAGEFTFHFVAGNVDEEGSGTKWGEGDISDKDPPVDVNQVIAVPVAGPEVWAKVMGIDDDWSFFTGLFSDNPAGIVGMGNTFDGDGTGSSSDPTYDAAWVTKSFDISNVRGKSEMPIEMATGDYGVAFTVFGRLQVEAVVPPSFTLRFRLTHRAVTVGVVGKAGDLAVMGNASGDGQRPGERSIVGLGSDGFVYHKAISRERPTTKHQGWVRLEGEVLGPVTALYGTGGRLTIFGFRRDGTLVCQTLIDGMQGGPWRSLGGPFRSPIAAAAGPNDVAEVLALTDEGVLFHRSLSPNQREDKPDGWERVGDKVGGSLTALSFPNGDLAVFALGQDGSIVHKRRSRYEWLPAGMGWQVLGNAPDSRLIAQPIGDNGLGGIALATATDDGSFRVAAWPDYPVGSLNRWRDCGTLASWLKGPAEPRPNPRSQPRSKVEAKPKKRPKTQSRRRSTAK
jgi:hypothetical protein